jgi:Flp pilus assembly protein TadG
MSDPRVRGQASVEAVAILPLLVAMALGVLQLLAAGATAELAGHAAEAGAVAVLQRQDATRAARAAVPGWSRGGLSVRVSGERVRVRARPPRLVPGLADWLTAESVAHAGPESR